MRDKERDEIDCHEQNIQMTCTILQMVFVNTSIFESRMLCSLWQAYPTTKKNVSYPNSVLDAWQFGIQMQQAICVNM